MIAIAKATEDISGVELEVTLRGGSMMHAFVTTLYDSTKDSIFKLLERAEKVNCPGTTPDGECFAGMLPRMLGNFDDTKRNIFVSFTDGAPDTPSLAKEQMELYRKSGFEVLAFLIDGYDVDSFKEIYGENVFMKSTKAIMEVGQFINNIIIGE